MIENYKDRNMDYTCHDSFYVQIKKNYMIKLKYMIK